MQGFFWSWAIAALVVGGAAMLIGSVAGRGLLGILVDERDRYSLTRFQIVIWSVVVLSVVGALFFARVAGGAPDALGFKIPNELLIVMGISIGSTVSATAIKAGKDARSPERIAAGSPRFSQIFLQEEGTMADEIVDVTKFQSFWVTLLLVVAYVALVISNANTAPEVAALALPGFDATFLTLLGISHAGYLAGKLPNQTGVPQGATMASREVGS